MTLKNVKTEKLPLIILTGPTAVGKTGLSIALAKRLDGEIISADSMQVYRGMDIGTAKIRPEEMQGVPHHLIDILDPKESFDVVQFQQLARQAIREIHERGHMPIVVGGTGFYIQALLYDIDFKEEPEEPESPDSDMDGKMQSLRQTLEFQASTEEGYEALVEELRQVDPETLEKVHPNNRKRVIRAVEFYRLHKVPISKHNAEERKRTSAYNSRYFVLTDDRAKLYARIGQRIDEMLEEGLVEEVRRLLSEGLTRKHISMQGIGYKEILDWLEGVCDYDTAIDTLKKNTRHFAKRQLTWFRRERDVIWLDRVQYPGDEDLLDLILSQI
ncbi:MAG: tRNA (adenosine(37)-N6)-dimethylallyltransferase MiaA [Eubacterium sp.]|nr:tRNA (adenosine(37)-N6)-dimethylallyltransferase MiaA [Eubacterium sp.]